MILPNYPVLNSSLLPIHIHSAQFGKTPYNLTDAVDDTVPLKIVQASHTEAHDYELDVCGVLFSELLKRAKTVKPNDKGEAFLDVNMPITDADFNCDFSSMNVANQKLYNQRILEAAKKVKEAMSPQTVVGDDTSLTGTKSDIAEPAP